MWSRMPRGAWLEATGSDSWPSIWASTVYNPASERRLIRLFSQDGVADRQDPTLTSPYDLCPTRPGSGPLH
jgi:hypothetical protein